MTLAADEFIRRFLIHVLANRPSTASATSGLFASHKRAENIARARTLLNSPAPQTETDHPKYRQCDERRRSRTPVRAAAAA